MTDDDHKHLCDACGEPIIGEHFTDEAVCGRGDGPGFYLCDSAECKAKRPISPRARGQYYTHQRERNEQQHSYTADSRVAFHIEMHSITEDETFDLGGLLGFTTDQLAGWAKSEVDKLIQEALADWVSNHVSSGWSIAK